ncbi:MAG TPA: N-6 DNA methylase [Sedimentisphaerales bacterium]|nr:N-6 DNA methylase [Sedimentisphaerales bacterium]
MRPKGAGPKVIAELARRKLKTAIKREGVNIEVGVLAADPGSNKTEDPLAIVCDFKSKVSKKVLRETHRLAWSFSRSPMLVTVEPTLIRVWTCWKRPVEKDEDLHEVSVEKLEGDLFEDWSLSAQAARSLQWVELTSGSFFRNPAYSQYFHRDQRADQLMLEDLRGLRRRLLDAELPEDICHDLIARVIFIEFLFQRKDSKGNAALNEKVVENLREKGVLSKVHKDLASILESKEETYRFFQELNDRFNGDLFPGKGETAEDREQEWKEEMRQVRAEPHLKLLGKFVSGKMEMAKGQLCLWKRYAFDVIPLEFISSIYEEFVSGKKDEEKVTVRSEKPVGIHYTPGHVVDLILDQVLPWDSKQWDLKILDPACGSGIFLVKAYQRLVHRWKNALGKPKVADLRRLLEKNLFGVDKDRDAVRVASFSLYLAMCDEIDPKHVWQKNVWFPRLRDRRLVESDFFAEDKEGFRTNGDNNQYDLVVGNAPWGKGTETEDARRWANRDRQSSWPIPNHNIGPLFMVKGAALTKRRGRVVMLQPAGVMLFNRESTARKFRSKFFETYRVVKIVNLSALRFVLFPSARSPACIVKMAPTEPEGGPIIYLHPKRCHTEEERYRIIIEPRDENEVWPEEAAQDPLVWTALAWGGRRDLGVMRRLCEETTLEKLEQEGIVKTRRGIGRGKGEERQDEIVGMPLLNSKTFPRGTLMYLDAASLKLNDDARLYKGHSKDLGAFNLPQMILKLVWRKDEGRRFKAALVKSNQRLGPVICSATYISVHVPVDYECVLESACLSLNSIIAVYFSLLSSGRFAFYRPSPNKEDLLRVPIPKCTGGVLKEIRRIQDVDVRAKEVFGLKGAEWVLVEDLFDYTLPDFKGGVDSPGRRSTRAAGGEQEGDEGEGVLRDYCDYFRRVVKAGFGEDKQVSATIFTEGSRSFLPVRLVGIHLEAPGKGFVRVERIDSPKLIKQLQKLNRKYLKTPDGAERGGIFYQRVARVYDTAPVGGREVPTVFIVKPDQIRYWTRSMAMRDADEVAGDIMLWREGAAAK